MFREQLKNFLEKMEYKIFIVEVFKGGIEEKEIYIEGGLGDALKMSKDELMKFLDNLEILEIYLGKRAAFILSSNNTVYVIHGVSIENFL